MRKVDTDKKDLIKQEDINNKKIKEIKEKIKKKQKG